MNRKSFVLYLDQKEIIDTLTDEQAGKLIKAIYSYCEGTDPELDPVLRLAFIPIKQTLRRDYEKWLNIVERNKENIKKRYQKVPTSTKSTSGKTGIPNPLDSDSDSDSDSDAAAANRNADDAISFILSYKGKNASLTNGKLYVHGKPVSSPAAYAAKLRESSPATPKPPKEMTDGELLTLLKGKKIGIDEGIDANVAYEAMERNLL